mgnify:CR=1 FL=1
MASGSSDGESEPDADEHELSLDEHGRTAIRGTCDYRPRVWDGVVAEAAVPALVADCVAAMRAEVAVPVTVKCRIGVDDQVPEEVLPAFAEAMRRAGSERLIVHARKAWLQGLSPKENRDVPPLDYPLVHELKAAMTDMPVWINGGITSLAEAACHLKAVDGVMIGRAAYHDPYLLAEVDERFHDAGAVAPSRAEIVEAFLPYLERQMALGVPLAAMTRHILGLYQGVPGARAWRRHLTVEAQKRPRDLAVVREALAFVERDRRAARADRFTENV